MIEFPIFDLLIHGVNSVWYSGFKQWNKIDSLAIPIKGAVIKYLNALALPLCVYNFLPHLNLNM